jgi:predicted Zn finger-like uncharacterized protein
MSEELNKFRLKCPNCGATYVYSAEKIDDEGFVECQNCAKQMFVRMSGEGAVATSAEEGPIVIEPSFVETATSVEGIKAKCPDCGAVYIYKDEQRLEDGRVKCQNCARVIEAVGYEVVIYQDTTVPEESDSSNAMLCCIILVILLLVPWFISVPLIICIFISQRDKISGTRKVVRKRATGPGPK